MSDQRAEYTLLLADIKSRVRHAQMRAVLSVNAEMLRRYWEIGSVIDRRQKAEGWGSSVIPRLARDLHNELPEVKGLSERNIKRMLAFYREYAYLPFGPGMTSQATKAPEVPQPVAQIPADLILSLPWGHHAELMSRVKDVETRQWYMGAAVEQERLAYANRHLCA